MTATPFMKIILGLGLLAATLAVYWQVGSHGFINFDDYPYVTENPQVLSGLTRDSIKWAFTTFAQSNWHPLTWLSHMADVQLFGMSPRGHHLTNVGLHLVNTTLLLFFLARATGAFGRSLIVAGLFALHPLHVESVAWVAERKDLLAGLFWLLTLLAYTRYAERPDAGRYLLVLGLFAGGLLAKPMLVTLPCVLLLLDYWPLRRFGPANAASLLWEKLPLLLMAAAAAVVTYLAQLYGESIIPVSSVPLSLRTANALNSYISYLGKTFWPVDLAVFYPLPQSIPWWQTVGATSLLLVITGLTARSARRRPWAVVGWLWFLGTLVPVIGLVQVGRQALADRYTYLPLIGIFILLTWGAAELADRWRLPRLLAPLAAGLALTGCLALTWTQLGYWQDSERLFRHALDVTANNDLAHNNLGNALGEAKRYREAIPHLAEALRINPRQPEACFALGNAYFLLQDYPLAVSYFARAIALKPTYGLAHYNLGSALWRTGRKRDAVKHYTEALRLDPTDAQARQSLADSLRALAAQ